MEKIQVILLVILGMTFYVNAITIYPSKKFTVTSFALDAIGVSIEDIENELIELDEIVVDINKSLKVPNTKKPN